MEEILRRLEENDLYIKLEKCIWKVRKIGFLGVVIGPKGIEMEEEKVDGVLSWPEPKNIKDIGNSWVSQTIIGGLLKILLE